MIPDILLPEVGAKYLYGYDYRKIKCTNLKEKIIFNRSCILNMFMLESHTDVQRMTGGG